MHILLLAVIQSLERERDDLLNADNTSRQKIQDLEKDLTVATQKIDEMNVVISKSKGGKKEDGSDTNISSGDIEKMKQVLEDKNHFNIDLYNELQMTKDFVTKSTAQMERQIADMDRLREEISSLAQSNGNKDDLIAELKIELKEASTKNSLYEKDIAELHKMRDQLLQVSTLASSLEGQLEGAKIELKDSLTFPRCWS